MLVIAIPIVFQRKKLAFERAINPHLREAEKLLEQKVE
ncbi:MAG: hypothetical protein ACI9Y1_001283 [Lentisphaeria bacterium]|jgi:hypothetical protein